MDELFSPDQVRSYISRAQTERQKAILFLLYNYGMTVEEVLSVQKKNFVVSREYLLFSFTRRSNNTKKSIRISNGDFYRVLYRILMKLNDDGAYLISKAKGQNITPDALKKDLFGISVITNKRITASAVFDSHLYWLFRKGLNYNHAIEEYGLKFSDRYVNLYEKAIVDGRIIPSLL